MGNAITIPAEYEDIIKNVQNDIIECNNVNDTTKIFSTSYINKVLDSINKQEEFIKEQFINQNNYVIDPSGETTLRFTGHYLLAISHLFVYLINARVIPISRLKQLFINIEPYLRSEGEKDGNCLVLLLLTARLVSDSRNDTSIGWKKYLEIVDYMNNIDPNSLDWIAGSNWTQSNNTNISKTPENIKKASLIFYNSFINSTGLYFNEIFNDEEKVLNILKEWGETQLKADQDNNIYPLYASYFQQYTPISISFFERPISTIWHSEKINDLDKIEVIFKVLKGIDAIQHFSYGGYNQRNIALFDKAKGREIIDQADGWIIDLFFKQFAIKDNAENINAMLKKLKAFNIYDNFIESFNKYISSFELIVSIYKEDLINVYNNIIKISNDPITLLFADAFGKCNLSSISNRLMDYLINNSNKKEYNGDHKQIGYVLTNSVLAGVPSKIIAVHNQENDKQTIIIDHMDGTNEKVSIEINNFFSEMTVTLNEPVVIRSMFDIALINIR